MGLICFGDSNTYGYDPRGYFGGRYDPADRWPERLALLTGWEVRNLGANGRQIPRNPAGQWSAEDRVLVMLGTNDLLQGADAQQTARRMEAFVRELLAGGCAVVLVCPPPMKRGEWVPTQMLVEESRRLGAEYESLARKLEIPFVDTRRWDLELAFDGVHLTEEGHRKFAEKLREVMEFDGSIKD